MKLIISSLTALLFTGAFLSAQMPGMVTMQQASASQGTSLGANTTSGAAGIALGNRVVMRGYVDFIYGHTDFSESLENDTRFSTSADVDFLFDFSPVTAEVHLAATTDDIGLEQAFGRYAFNRDFNISFGRQVTSLGYEGDEATDLSSVSTAYFTDITLNSTSNQNFLQQNLTTLLNSAGITNGTVNGQMYSTAGTFSKAFVDALPKLRKNYVDGIKANFNNGKFGLSLGVHDGYWGSDDFNDNVAVDIAASLMIIPGLEARLGYAHQDSDSGLDVGHFNGWLAYNPGDLTLALEFDTFDIQTETERSNYFMFVGRMCTTLDPSLQGSNCPAGMISCDMLSVLCYLWIYSKLSVALRLNKTCNPHNAWSILFKWVSSHEAKGSNSDTWIRFKRLASFRKGDIF